MKSVPTNSTTRFSNRVDAYVKYRPSYPTAVVQSLAADVGLTPQDPLADIGYGTGLSTKLFLDHGNPVVGIEPNKEMREAGERYLAGYPKFRSINATAEATTLPDHSLRGIIAGQAFHWFDPAKTRTEFLRILQPGGWVALLWNSRPVQGTPFLDAYEQLVVDFGTDYTTVNHGVAVTDFVFKTFFGPGAFQKREFPNRQVFDFDGLYGRVLSSSYMPDVKHLKHPAMLEALKGLFARHQQAGTVNFDYTTELYVGRLK